jgi:eukaryotic-like serine/threonine-protein kinase
VAALGTEEAEALRATDGPTKGDETGTTPPEFGKYRLHRRLARGGMGEVYLASLMGELGFEKRLVIKTILPRFASQPRFIELFAAEAKTAVALSHGNIVPIYELGRAGDTFYIVMGYVDGPSVAELLVRYRETGRAPDLESALHVIRGVLTGLAYAHTEEPGRPAVVHRDITPRNVLIDRSGQVRIVDFGIALPAHVQVDLRAGSTGYVAPEQARAEAADPAADVFSAGCLLYELLTHEAAFPREGVWTKPDLSSVPEAVRAPLERALSIDPQSRPRDAGEFLEALAPAFARHATTFGDALLAGHLRSVFPDGWSHDATDDGDDGIAPPGRKASKTQTFATRLTAVTSVNVDVEGPKSRPATDPEAVLDGAASAPEASGAGRPAALASVSTSGLRPAALDGARRSSLTGLLIGATTAAVVLLFALPRLNVGATPETDPGAPAPMPAEAELAAIEPTPRPDPAPESLPAEPTQHRHLLHVEPPDAEIVIDGQPRSGTSPHAITIDGDDVVSITVRKPGFEPHSIELRSDTPIPDVVRLEKLRPKGNGFLRVTAPGVPWAEVVVDGRRRGSTPTRALALPAGNHRVKVRCIPDACPAERLLFDKTVKIEPDTTTDVTAQ